MLNRINQIFSGRGVNIGAQYLQTDPEIGYVVIDIDDAAVDAEELLQELRAASGHGARAVALHAQMSAPQASPAIILVRPQLGENVGMAARAMANFGLADLRLVAPRDGWGEGTPVFTAAVDAAVGAHAIVRAAPRLPRCGDSSGRPPQALRHHGARTRPGQACPDAGGLCGGSEGADRRGSACWNTLWGRTHRPHQRGGRTRRRHCDFSRQPGLPVAESRAVPSRWSATNGSRRRRAARPPSSSSM